MPSAQFFGLLCLSLYICSDAFTSQWQDRIYKAYPKQIDQFQMMYGVNCSAIIITMLALLFSGELAAVLEFLTYHPQALWFNVITAITSATGQLFIFYTIKQFGPVVFTIIMTTRQVPGMPQHCPTAASPRAATRQAGRASSHPLSPQSEDPPPVT